MKKYQIVLADPPWHYKVWSEETGAGRSASSHYLTMDIKEIKSLRIADICEKNSVLFLWVTSPCLIEGIDVMRAWGFRYKTVAFCWVKKNKKNTDSLFWGMGYYTRANIELCLLGTRGKPLPRESRAVHQVIESPVMRHSQKPAEVRSRIVELFGNLPRIELFAREKVPGWDAVGFEIDGKDIREQLTEIIHGNFRAV